MANHLFYFCLYLWFCLSKIASGIEADAVVAEKLTVYGERPASTELGSSEVPSEEILSAGEQLERTLVQSPSVTLQRSRGEGGEPTFLIRGQDSIQNRFFLEGAPLSDAQFHQGDLSLLPSSEIFSTHVYAGAIPLSYGSDGLGGAMDFRLRPMGETKRVRMRVGSFGYQSVEGAFDVHRPKTSLSLGYRRSKENFAYFDDLGTPFNPEDDLNGVRAHNGFWRVSLLPRFSLLKDRITVWSLNSFGNTEIPGPIRIPTRANLRRYFHLTGLNYSGPPYRSNAIVYFRRDDQDLQHYSSPLIASDLSRRTLGMSVGGRYNISFPLGQNRNSNRLHEMELSSGLEFESYERAITGAHPSTKSERGTLSTGLSTRFYVGSSDSYVQPALLGHLYLYDHTASAQTRYALFSPRVTAVHRFSSDLRVRSAFGSYYRAPNMFELFGQSPGFVGNSTLQPERSVKLEGGVDWSSDRFSEIVRYLKASYSLSVSWAKDLISYQQNSQLDMYSVNVGASRMTTHELGLELGLWKNWTIRGSGNLIHAKNTTEASYLNGKTIPLRPSLRITGSLLWEKNWLQIGYEIGHTGSMWWDVANTRELSSVTEHGIRADFDLGSMGKLNCEILNLLDVTTANSALIGNPTQFTDNTSGYPGYPSPGRRVYVTWNLNL